MVLTRQLLQPRAHGYFSTAALSPTLSERDHAAPPQPDRPGAPEHDRPRHHDWHRALEWRWRQLPHHPALLRDTAPLGTHLLALLSPASPPAR
ncbi:MAG: hypothetical protein AVDCRST_MAG93-7358 [uncultured Chloroflexia bacterium]|uniref:Uncharacterized protein n=1 Tax=uncultured Chloroflexia bacterium TaxID=1672391 RepID=A0A6J4MDX6_9CHLR|nr:MAG: hypothetical protein AVDCRST_MAG93-7358 [uncultured Chloroflexia bacterium]